jgi:hypothetical protein
MPAAGLKLLSATSFVGMSLFLSDIFSIFHYCFFPFRRHLADKKKQMQKLKMIKQKKQRKQNEFNK